MLPRDFKLAEKLRSAMSRAGIVLGYKHVCRRCKAKRIDSHEDAADGAIRRCPKCNAKMWPSALPKPCTFHELRHTSATLLLAAGADLWAVQKMLRHTDAQVTPERYAHLVPGYLHTQIGRLKLTGFASPLLPPAENDEGLTQTRDRNNQLSQGGELERETGFEPATLSLGMGLNTLASSVYLCQPRAITRREERARGVDFTRSGRVSPPRSPT